MKVAERLLLFFCKLQEFFKSGDFGCGIVVGAGNPGLETQNLEIFRLTLCKRTNTGGCFG